MQSKEIYEWEKYSFCKGSFETCQDIGNDIAGTQYDIVHMKWGGSWVLPSKDQLDELRNNCTSKWITVNGICGKKVTGKNGNSIFLPAAGYCHDSNIWDEITTGYYWSSTMNVSTYNDKPYLDEAFCLYFNHAGSVGLESGLRCTGNYIRPVSK